ncbi:cytochrome c peroxidase [Actimicrobium sp. CCC2.4]|uniref:cytochrome-c peroxidase n=1 Tax=Actimicrobium sp. CCC2.4 TaxID=3048606 RepID=UPI002AC91B98|nr:cytochrome c peroxidase [Actimicrobium sp. CCC2.4]MEB0135377.1 cytochrome c peroxidase [Actimicrobium sp. CCC2.4]WPX32448.1 cytochrome c peroxidase [Actimicrobium sp. CCC2.4]
MITTEEICVPARQRVIRHVRQASLIGLAVGMGVLQAQASTGEPAPLASLKTVPVPAPPPDQLAAIVQDKRAAIQLGKALFWDTRVGSDNKTACATCHFHAGADNRVKNQINPGLLAGDKTFQLGGPNATLTAADFPLTRFANPDLAGTRGRDVNDVVSSQGVLTTLFGGIDSRGGPDRCSNVPDVVGHGGSGFSLGGVNTRRVEPRNAPGIFNAVFNFRNFWDGRGNNMTNGIDPFGLRNTDAQVWTLQNGVVRPARMTLSGSALGSVASGPPLSENEMSCRNRSFANLGRKLAGSKLLADQRIAPDDSVLGPLARNTPTYAELVKQAYRPEYWRSGVRINVATGEVQRARQSDLERSRHDRSSQRPQNGDQISQAEANFSLFFSLAVQLYQATLVSDDTPFDRYAAGNKQALTTQQVRGLTIFRGPAQCVRCHAGPELTSASVSNVTAEGRLDQRPGANNSVFRYDNGFFNTGVRPTADDPGVGGLDPFGNPLSETRMAIAGKTALLGSGFDPAKEVPVTTGAPLAIDGAFKTPGLRNVELTGPYFHNGGKSTLMQVVDFYNRGGDFTAANQPVPDPTMRPLGLTQPQKDDLVAFLLSLTDERVRFQRAPFDHPSICVPDGQEGDARAVVTDAAGNAKDVMRCIGAVGTRGAAAALPTFLRLSPFAR